MAGKKMSKSQVIAHMAEKMSISKKQAADRKSTRLNSSHER